jgi:dTDP-4-dehydrorhamnose reductase
MSTPPTWLVTGAHGFLGANLGAYLEGRVHRVGAVRAASDRDVLFDRYVHLDLEHPDSLLSFIEQERPDVVVHAAALAAHAACEADPPLAERLNAQSSGLLAEAAARAGSHFVLISTDAVFDGVSGH